MTDPFVPRVGAVLSGDIAVPEHERELAFYSSVLTTGETPRWREDLMNDLGMPVIGLGKRTPELEGLPLQWMPHMQVADVAASAKAAVENGGTELMHGKDDDGNSQWAVFRDPAGAAFGITPVPPAEAIPPHEGGENAGRIAWFDLTVPDAEAVRDFYCTVVGWKAEAVPMGSGDDAYADFNMLDANGEAVGGVCHARGGNADVPTVWMLYLPVGDLAESVRRVKEGGGEVLKASSDLGGKYATAIVRDPVGVCFALAKG